MAAGHSPSGHRETVFRGFESCGGCLYDKAGPMILPVKYWALLVFGLTWALPGAEAKRAPVAVHVPRCVAPSAERATAKPPAGDSDAAPPQTAPDAVWTDGSVTVGGATIAYCAVAGTLVVHPKGWDDSAAANDPASKSDADDGTKNPTAEASIFYVAYFRRDADATARPVTFLFNGGPGSATV